MKRAWIIASLIAVSLQCRGAITDSQATNAIIGEAGSESFYTQLAVASAIRNRGSLRGVYGVTNPVVRKASAGARQLAAKAWQASASSDVTHGLKYFGCKTDAPYFKSIGMRPAMQVGAITFWK